MEYPRWLPLLLAFCMFSTGASGLVNEYVLATLTTYILGNSIEQFSIVIALMMLMMGVSGLVQNKISDDNLILKFMGIEVVMAMLGGFAPLAIYAAYAFMDTHFLLVHYFFVLAIGFLIGFEIPIVMRIIEQNKVKLKTNLTIVYAMDYIGAFVGAMVWVKYLLKNYSLTEISFIVAGFNFLVAAITIVYFMKSDVIKPRYRTSAVLISTILILYIGFANSLSLTDVLEQKFYEDPIAHKETTRYQHIVITENTANGDVRLYINGNTQFSSLDEDRYHELLVHPVMSLPKHGTSVLILGGGDGLALREVLKYKTVESVTLVDLDPDMVRLAKTNSYLRRLNKDSFRDARLVTSVAGGITELGVKGLYMQANESASELDKGEWVASIMVVNLDADLFLNKIAKKKWDVVIIDLPDPSSVELAKLYSKQFYKKLKRNLSKDGFVAIQSTSPYHAKSAFLTIGSTLEAAGYKVLPYRQNIPSFGDWGFHIAWTDKKPVSEVKGHLSKVDSFPVDTRFITPELMMASTAFGQGELVSGEECVNTIMNPCLVTQYLDYSWQIE